MAIPGMIFFNVYRHGVMDENFILAASLQGEGHSALFSTVIFKQHPSQYHQQTYMSDDKRNVFGLKRPPSTGGYQNVQKKPHKSSMKMG